MSNRMKSTGVWTGSFVLAAVFASVFASGEAHAAGYEKSVFWSGHYTGIAGAAQSSVTGPEALYWNPAGLGGTQGLGVSANFSPTWAMYSGPFSQNQNQVQDSNTTFIPIGGAFASYGLTPQWGVGVGYYVSAGTRADYDSVGSSSLSALGITYAPPIKADLTVTELSLGTGYELAPGFKLGIAYRVVFVSGTLDSAGTTGAGATTQLIAYQVNDISKTAWSGLRVGLEWAPKDSAYGFGVTYRNRVPFNAGATGSVTAAGNGVPGAGLHVGSNESVLVQTTLPQRVDAAAHYRFIPSLTGYVGYSFSNYSEEQVLGVSGLTAAGTPVNGNVPQAWMNMHNIRGALEYTGIQDWAIRGGYVWTSQVTPVGNALPTLSAPGTGNTLVAGAGHQLMEGLTVDGAFEYSWDAGTVASTDAHAATTGVGDFSAKAYAVHLGATLQF